MVKIIYREILVYRACVWSSWYYNKIIKYVPTKPSLQLKKGKVEEIF